MIELLNSALIAAALAAIVAFLVMVATDSVWGKDE